MQNVHYIFIAKNYKVWNKKSQHNWSCAYTHLHNKKNKH